MKFFKRLLAVIAVMAVATTSISVMGVEVEAASKNKGKATLRILSTTDLHGQAGFLDYHKATDNLVGSLSQIQTLIKKSKSSLKNGATLLVDSGDTAFGYLDHKIAEDKLDYNEYMFATMKYMGYDAITMGNHDFEFGYDFLEDQLERAGMTDNVVLANVHDIRTGENLWAGHKIITKSMTTDKGKKVNVKVGVIGVTAPLLLNTIYNHVGILSTDDIVESVKSEVAQIKDKTDVIVVIAHASIGMEDYVDMGNWAGHELSKIDGVDVVCAGHAHVNFPSTDENVENIWLMPGVASNGLMNGTAVVETANAGIGMGQTDIQLEFKNGKVNVVSKKVDIKYVKKTTEPDQGVENFLNKYNVAANIFYSDKIANIEGNMNNYFGIIEDNAAVHIANEAKLQFGLKYARGTEKYKDYNIIAASTYNLAGYSSANDYINIDGAITEKDLLNIQQYNNCRFYVMPFTGKEIREWIELNSASMFTQSTGKNTYIISDEWEQDWSGFNVIDGVEYVIDTTLPARYDSEGNIINKSSHRVTKLTCNGKEVEDSDKFLFVLDRTEYDAEALQHKVAYTQKIRPNEMFRDYIQSSLDNEGYYPATYDDNWNIIFDPNIIYAFKTSANSYEASKTKEWVDLDNWASDNYIGYDLRFNNNYTDTAGPLLVIAKNKTIITGEPVSIYVQATDKSNVSVMKYLRGKVGTASEAWSTADIIKNNQFTVSANGSYTVMAEDKLGNRTVKYVGVDNIVPGAVEAPTIGTFNNWYKNVKGTAQPGTTVYALIRGVTYSCKTGADGKYECPIACANVDEKVVVWAENSVGTKSLPTEIITKRNAGNVPDVFPVDNKDTVITGERNDERDCFVVAMDSEHLYYPEKADQEMLEYTTLGYGNREVVKCPYEIDLDQYSLRIPILNAETELKVYCLDWIGRASRPVEVKVEKVAPNMPKVNKVYNTEKTLYGRVPDAGGVCEIKVVLNDSEYIDYTDIEGNFAVECRRFKADEQVKVFATETIGDSRKTSAVCTFKVADATLAKKYDASSEIDFDRIDDRSLEISGMVYDDQGPIDILVKNKVVTVELDEDGYFTYELEEPLPAGTIVAATGRNSKGKLFAIGNITVQETKPSAPVLLTKNINANTKKIKVFSDKQALLTVKIGEKVYKVEAGKKNTNLGGFVYTIKIDPITKPKRKVIMRLKNSSGWSKKTILKTE